MSRLVSLAAASAVVALGLSACVWSPGQHMRASAPSSGAGTISDDGRIELIAITPRLIAMDAAAREQDLPIPGVLTEYRPPVYRIGAGDVLYITVWEHPELTVPAGSQQQMNAAGRVVQADGTLFYPYIGVVEAAGKTPVELRERLAASLATYIESPQVDVSVLDHASQRVWVTGAVENSSTLPLTVVPMTLADAISRTGLDPSQADLSGLRLTRDGVTYTLDLERVAGSPVFLKDNDHIHVPYLEQKEVFVVGEVNLPGAQSFRAGSISLSHALGRARGLAQTSAQGNAVYVIRGTEDLAQAPSAVYQLEAKSPSAFAVASQFELLPGDVVFVGAAGITRWNRFVTQLLPFSSIINTSIRTSTDL